MKASLIACILGPCILQISCTTLRPEKDDLCRQITRFANHAPTHAPRTVRLTTDWGGVFSNSNAMAEKTCLRAADKASEVLCTYLLANTSTEFAAVNYRRVLACIGRASPGVSPTDDQSLPPSASSGVVDGKPVRSRVTVVFTPGTRDSPPALAISAGGAAQGVTDEH